MCAYSVVVVFNTVVGLGGGRAGGGGGGTVIFCVLDLLKKSVRFL